jgi:DNA-binding IclR family transcriptional regulator
MAATINSVLAATRILTYLASRRRVPVGLTEIARQTGVYKGTCHNILKTLQSQEYVVHDPATRGYVLGPALIELGAQAVNDPAYVQVAMARLGALSETTAATCHLSQRVDDDQIQVVGRVDGPAGLVLVSPVGQRHPLWGAPSVAPAFLAWLDAEEQRSTLERLEGRGFFAAFGSDWPGFEAHLAQVRACGYAVRRGLEDELGADALAILSAPIFSRTGRVALVASVTLIGSRARPQGLPRVAALLMAATREITAAVGGALPPDYPTTPSRCAVADERSARWRS